MREEEREPDDEEGGRGGFGGEKLRDVAHFSPCLEVSLESLYKTRNQNAHRNCVNQG